RRNKRRRRSSGLSTRRRANAGPCARRELIGVFSQGVFFPNLRQFRIEVIDTNNDPILTFGQYGNEDSGGPNARIKKPAIPLAWPVYVAASDRWAYVADTVNRRVVRVRLRGEAEETCAVR